MILGLIPEVLCKIISFEMDVWKHDKTLLSQGFPICNDCQNKSLVFNRKEAISDISEDLQWNPVDRNWLEQSNQNLQVNNGANPKWLPNKLR
jgi:hypothetical protein